MKLNQYALAAISAYIIWGFIVLPLRQVSSYPSTQILFYRILIAFFCLPLIVAVFRRKSVVETYHIYRQSTRSDKRRFWALLLLSGLLLTANWLLFIYVVNRIDVQTASFAYMLCPIITAGLGFIILRESLRINQWAAIAISLGSCALVGINSVHHLTYSLLIAGSYALYLITQRVLKQYDKMVLLAVQTTIGLIVVFCLGPDFRGSVPTSGYFYAVIFVLSTAFTILPLFLNLYALKELKSATIGILMYINPLISFGIAFLYFGETASIEQLVAYALILFSIILYNLNPPLRQPKPTTSRKVHS